MSNLQRILSMAAKALDKKGQQSSGGSGKTDWREMVRTAADKVTETASPLRTARRTLPSLVRPRRLR